LETVLQTRKDSIRTKEGEEREKGGPVGAKRGKKHKKKLTSANQKESIQVLPIARLYQQHAKDKGFVLRTGERKIEGEKQEPTAGIEKKGASMRL